MPTDAPTAFFSYSRDDSEFALRLAEDLKAGGANVWLDQLDIQPGQRWARAVQDALNNSPRMLVILSPSAVNSTHVEDEVNFALDEQKTVIPVFYQDCKVPFQLRPFQYVDFRNDYARGLKVMLKTLGVEQQATATAAAASAALKETPTTVSDQDERKRAAEQARLEGEERERQADGEARLEEEHKQAAEEKFRLEQEEREQQAAEKARPERQERERLEQERSPGSIPSEIPGSFARSPAWMKIALAACGVLVVGFVLYFAMRSSEQKEEAQKADRAAADKVAADRAAAEKTAADKAAADKVAANKAAADRAAVDRAAVDKAAIDKLGADKAARNKAAADKAAAEKAAADKATAEKAAADKAAADKAAADKAAAEAVALAFLKLTDQEDLEGAYRMAGEQLKHSTPKSESIAGLKVWFAAKGGAATSRELVMQRTYTEAEANAAFPLVKTKGSLYGFRYRSNYPKGIFFEDIYVSRDSDGVLRINGHMPQPA